jgi:hypothetical protein
MTACLCLPYSVFIKFFCWCRGNCVLGSMRGSVMDRDLLSLNRQASIKGSSNIIMF